MHQVMEAKKMIAMQNGIPRPGKDQKFESVG